MLSNMKTALIIFITTVLRLLPGFAQPPSSINLVRDPGFENKTHCPYKFTTPDEPIPLKDWYSPSLGTPDLFSACTLTQSGVPKNWAGFSYSIEGDCFIGMYLGLYPEDTYREYISTELKDTLQQGVIYDINLFLKPASNSKFNLDSISLVFTPDRIEVEHASVILDTRLQKAAIMGNTFGDPKRWNIVSTTYVANGGERYFTLGNFEIPGLSNYSKLFSGPSKSHMLTSSAYYLFDYVVISSPNHEMPFPVDEPFFLETLYFEFDEYEVRNKCLPEIKMLSNFLNDNPDFDLIIKGHADVKGSDDYNEKLSLRRALKVQRLMKNNGVHKDRMKVQAFGESLSSGRIDSLNRRVEFEILNKRGLNTRYK